jgi:RNA polymerase sigma-70 factor, ECF subfamily
MTWACLAEAPGSNGAKAGLPRRSAGLEGGFASPGWDVTTFSDLFQAHSRDVYRFALFLSGDHDLAEDIASETFIRVWHARERLDLATVKAYLLAIARNLYLDQCRRAARRAPLVDHHVDPRPGPEALTSSRAELRAVLADLQELPEIDRAAVLLRAEEGLSYDEIGALLGLTPIAARVKVHRARTKLTRAADAAGTSKTPRRELG